MTIAKQIGLPSEHVDELGEIERQMQLWDLEAVLLGRSLEAIGVALRVDASQIHFRGDLIVLEGASRDLTVSLARIRNVVCNLKVLQAQHKQFEAPDKSIRRAW